MVHQVGEMVLLAAPYTGRFKRAAVPRERVDKRLDGPLMIKTSRKGATLLSSTPNPSVNL